MIKPDRKKKKKLKVKGPETSVSSFRYTPVETLIEIKKPDVLPATIKQPIPSDDWNTWHDKLGILIPNDLLPYVTEDPIYVSKRQEKLKGKHLAPGTKKWFEAIEDRKRAAEQIVENETYMREWTARAKLWGTSFNSIEHRVAHLRIY
ncbi:hypothetical protein RhiirC2_720882 [Rhizophagus irregularis]|uniref:Uncharacterized protein n=1 Tax=Rhizophagus irregularis TaxID=588596 RepID=A0A2N1M8H1_9GLOM|nr:hypothetical protein RhiirC2_720882 [Rhizophagus irregularis]